MGHGENDIERFVEAQSGGEYERALAEIRQGRKRSHWIWYIFPQVAGLGRSGMSIRYGIGSASELEAYMANPILSKRIKEISQALLDLGGSDPETVLGGIDALKVRSSMTLFQTVSDDPVFANVLDRYFGGQRDQKTLQIISSWSD